MNRLAASDGVQLTTVSQVIAENPAGSKEARHLALRFCNIDGAATAYIAQCVRTRANKPDAPIIGVNTPVKTGAEGTLQVTMVLEPGDAIKSIASANGDIFVIAIQIDAEARP